MDIVAVTRRLSAETAIAAYERGLFPMYAPSLRAITWHCPEKRALLPLDSLHVPRRLERTIRQRRFDVTFDRAFREVMKGCAEGRSVWIGPEFFDVYAELHARGRAHSVEVWSRPEGPEAPRLVGGTYGVHLGGAFFAESKFHRERDASKVALVSLARRLRERQFLLLEVQYVTDHLRQFGVSEVPHQEYTTQLATALAEPRSFSSREE
jgi:leucyl/phenylalanyl-tRNA--protein transferase